MPVKSAERPKVEYLSQFLARIGLEDFAYPHDSLYQECAKRDAQIRADERRETVRLVLENYIVLTSICGSEARPQ